MIALETNLPELESELMDEIRLFPEPPGDTRVLHEHAEEGGCWVDRFSIGETRVEHRAEIVRGGLEEIRLRKRAAKTGCFLLMREATGANPPWGSLTGIRPTRLFYELTDAGIAPGEAEKTLCERYFVAPEKARLLREIAEMQTGIREGAKDEYDVYVAIPFCVTRCAYCSFPAAAIGSGKLVEPYLEALEREIALCLPLVRHLRPRAVYVGGGTPTSLDAEQLKRLLERLNEAFPGARERTVEAGRPDTITVEKLRSLRDAGTTRISVNPQTFSDDTLRRIGRAHTADDTRRAYLMARDEGFDDINMDLIAALPGENEADFSRTLDETLALFPDSVTVHTLAVKRASRLHEFGCPPADAEAAARMVDEARSRLCRAGYAPYYLYRQKYMAGNLENVGYARPGSACLYNVGNMEETMPVLALGAGAITKWLFPRKRRIERAPNLRSIEEYIERTDEMVARKREVLFGKDDPT